MQSPAKATGLPSSSASLSATGFRLNCGSGPPLGRPKCEMTITLAPRLARSCRPGTTRSSRVASVTLPSLHRHVEIGAHQHALARDVEAGGGLELVEVHVHASGRDRAASSDRCRPAAWRGRAPAVPETSPRLVTVRRLPGAVAVVGLDLHGLQRHRHVMPAVRHAGIDLAPPGLVGLSVAARKHLEQHEGVVGDGRGRLPLPPSRTHLAAAGCAARLAPGCQRPASATSLRRFAACEPSDSVNNVRDDQLMVLDRRRVHDRYPLDQLPALLFGPRLGEREELLDRQLLLRARAWGARSWNARAYAHVRAVSSGRCRQGASRAPSAGKTRASARLVWARPLSIHRCDCRRGPPRP